MAWATSMTAVPAVQAPAGPHGIAERPAHHGGAVRAAEHGEGALSPVGHRHLVAVPPAPRRGPAHRGRHLRRGGGPTELVGRSHHSHRRSLPRGTHDLGWRPWPTRPSSSSRTGVPSRSRRDPTAGSRRRRGAGGLVSGLAPLVIGTDTTWIAAALSPGDREAAAGGVIEAEGFRVRTLALDPEDQRQAYDEVCNATLWFVHHGLYALAREPSFGPDWWEAWSAYGRVNEAFARAVMEVAPDGATVLVQDYHLSLVGPLLRAERPDLRSVHFSHTPFAEPDGLHVLPPEPRRALLEGMAANRACGFHTRRWAAAFEASCDDAGVPRPATFVSPLAPDPDDIAATAGSKPCLEAAGLARRRARRPAADHEGRPHRALQEPPARLRRLRPPARASPRAPGAGGVRCLRLPVARGRAGLRRVPHRGRRRGGAAQPAVGHGHLAARPLRRLGRLPEVGGRPAAGRRAAREPDPRRPQPRRQGGPARQRPRRGAAAQHRGRQRGTSCRAPRGRSTPTTSSAPPMRSTGH